MTLLELAERCERAEAPDSELDCAISLALVVPPEGCKAVASQMSSQAGLILDRVGRIHGTVDYQPFTFSIDAAMTLVPDGCGKLSDSPGSYKGKPWAHINLPNDGPIPTPIKSSAATEALAICAAALRARAQPLTPLGE